VGKLHRANAATTRESITLRRSEYETAGLEAAELDPHPLRQWMRWYEDAAAAGVTEPNAVVLSTCDADGWPDARVVLVRDASEAGLSFFTNYDSKKGRDIATQPHVSMTSCWLDLHRQVRIRGVVEKITSEESDVYWASRPKESQLASAASPQSSEVHDRAELEHRVDALREQWSAVASVPRPDSWGGYRLIPHEVEFWQGRPARLHDRLCYRRSGDAWMIVRLAP
jgi:pyridoxamine 5'-phosphate oxidase